MVNEKEETFLDQLIRYGIKMQLDREKKVNALFDMHLAVPAVRPEPVRSDGYLEIELLNKERELVGIYLSAHPLDNYAFEIKHFVTHSLPDAAELIKEFSGSNHASAKEVTVAGLVTLVKRSVAKKTGQPWASFTIEDFKGSLSFSLFGKDYENFMGYLEPGQALFIRCVLQPRYGSRGNEWELKASAISLLANIKDELVKKICLKFPVETITPEFRKELLQALKEHSGKTRLEIKIVDKENQIVVDFFSRSFRVSMNPGFVTFLERNEIEYQL